MGPSIRIDGDQASSSTSIPPIVSLQWGRRFGSTETDLVVLDEKDRMRELQWGRRFGSTETNCSRAVTARAGHALQWGRRFGSTETTSK